jgi:hypothetical protein
MSHTVSAGKSPMRIITMSWDDGGEDDIRLAEILSKHGIRGTFYIPVRHEGKEMLSRSHLELLVRLGHECGSHTVNHRRVNQLDAADLRYEVEQGKRMLEDMIGGTVSAFCYPNGRFSKAALEAVRESGFRVARTTQSLRMDLDFDPLLMPVTFQIYPHGKFAHFRHAVREWNWPGLMQWGQLYKEGSSIDEMLEAALARLESRGGLLHLWGHSREIAQLGWWDRLDGMCRRLSRIPQVIYADNSSSVEYIRTSPAGSFSNPRAI